MMLTGHIERYVNYSLTGFRHHSMNGWFFSGDGDVQIIPISR